MLFTVPANAETRFFAGGVNEYQGLTPYGSIRVKTDLSRDIVGTRAVPTNPCLHVLSAILYLHVYYICYVYYVCYVYHVDMYVLLYVSSMQ